MTTKELKPAKIVHKTKPGKTKRPKHLAIRLFLGLVLVGLLTGFTFYEVSSILEKEHTRQFDIFISQQEQISFNLNMLKISVFTKEPESYHDNLESAKQNLETIKTLSFIIDEQAKYIEQSENYLSLLTEKESALSEMKTLAEEIDKIKETLTSSFGDKDSITRDALKSMGSTVQSLKIELEKYLDGTVLTIAKSVNEALDNISNTANELSNCIDTCYENKFTSIANALSDKIKPLVENFSNQNAAFEKIFLFDE